MSEGSSTVLNEKMIQRYSRLANPDPAFIRFRMDAVRKTLPYVKMDNQVPLVVRERVQDKEGNLTTSFTGQLVTSWGGIIYLSYMGLGGDPFDGFNMPVTPGTSGPGAVTTPDKFNYIEFGQAAPPLMVLKSDRDNVAEPDFTYYGLTMFAKEAFDCAYADYTTFLYWAGDNRNLWGNSFGGDMFKSWAFGGSGDRMRMIHIVDHFLSVADRVEEFNTLMHVDPFVAGRDNSDGLAFLHTGGVDEFDDTLRSMGRVR